MARSKWLLMTLAVAAVAFAWTDNTSGSWKGSMQLNGGSDQPACMTVKQEGSTLTGTAGACQGKEFPITKGTINGDVVTVEAHPGTPTLRFTMKFAGNKLKGDVFETTKK